MKRFLTLLAATVIVMAAMAQSSGIVLSYNKGKELKYFRPSELADAINEAEVNDTIYFGLGKFDLSGLPSYKSSSSDKHIDKPLVFIGSCAYGYDENYNITEFANVGNLYISADSSLDESKKKYSFEGIDINSSYNNNEYYIRPASDLNEIKLANFSGKFSDANKYEDEQFVIKNVIVDRSLLTKLNLYTFKTRCADIRNTFIVSNIDGGCDKDFGVATLDHCFIGAIYSNFVGLVQHSLINYTHADNQTSLVDCIYYNDDGNSYKDGCSNINSDLGPFNWDPSKLGKNCNDGTPYGVRGGLTPYTLHPQYPTADISVDGETNKAKSFVDYDNVNKKLTITVNLLGH